MNYANYHKKQIDCFYIVTCYNQISKTFSKVHFQICGIDHRLIKSLNNALLCLNLRKNFLVNFLLYFIAKSSDQKNIKMTEQQHEWNALLNH